MSNKEEEDKNFLDTDDVVSILAERLRFPKKDVKDLLDEMRLLFEECVEKDVEIKLRGLIHVRIAKIRYKTPPGIVGYHGNKDFNLDARKVIYAVPLNIKDLLRSEDKKKIKKVVKEAE